MTISPEHYERYITGSSISEAVAEARGYRTIPDTEDGERELARLGFKRHRQRPTLLIPLHDVLGGNGRYQHRPDVEVLVGRGKKPAKYIGQDGKTSIIDVHPYAYEWLQDTSRDLWVTEGVRKADSAVSHGLCCVGLMSVTTWEKTDWKMIPVEGRNVYVCFDSDVMTKQDVRRQMRRIGGWLEDARGATVFYVYLPPTPTGEKVGLDDYFAAGGTVEQVYTYASPVVRDGDILPAWSTDAIGNAERFVYYQGDKARYIYGVGWHVWNEMYWKRDETERVVLLAEDVARKIHNEVAETADQGRQNELRKHARRVADNVKKMLEQAQPHLAYTNADFNTHPLLVNFHNGTVDLRTGAVQPHDPDDMLTFCAAVDYNPAARCDLWDWFLARAFPNPEIRAFARRLAGMSLIGDNREERLVIAQGLKGAGKGTFAEALVGAFGLGGYVEQAHYESFLQRPTVGGARSDLAALSACRIVFTSEFPSNKRVDTELIKGMTGGDPIKVRHLYQEEFTFYPQFTVWLFAENEPDVPPDDGGYWRRAIKLPFEADNDPGALDLTIKQRLRNPDFAGEAVAAWVVAGAMEYLRDGLIIPDAVTKATKEYRATQNPVTPFVTERCDISPALSVENRALKNAYEQWRMADPSTRSPLSDKRFSQLVATMEGVHGRDTNRGKLWEGIGLHAGGDGGGRDSCDSSFATLESPIAFFPRMEVSGNDEKLSRPVTALADESSLSPHIEGGAGPVGYVIVDRASEACALINRLPPTVPIDIETTGLNPRTDTARLLTVHDGTRAYIIDMAKTGLIPLAWFGSRELIGHNLQFEFGFLPPTKETRAWDTMIAAQVLDAGLFVQKGHFTLASLTQRFCGVDLDKSAQMSDWSGDLTDDQLRYAALDVSHLHQIKQRQIGELSAASLMPTAELEMRALLGVSWLARTGVPFDLDAWMALARENMEKQEAMLHELRGYKDINWNSPKQIADYFAGVGVPLNSTGEAALAEVARPEAALLLEYRGMAKATGTYGENWRQYVHGDRIYAGWKQCFTATGRMSCAEPNLQNLPRDPRVRACFRAGDGRVLVSADYAQIEARCAAVISGDPKLLAVFHGTDDVYATVARQLTGNPRIQKGDPERQMAKSATLGLLFGMGTERFISYARTNGVTEEMADDSDLEMVRHNFFKTFPRLRQWQREQGADEITETFSLNGRRRLDQKFYSEKLNHPVQSSAADGMKAALARLWEESSVTTDASPVLCIHDSLTVECNEGKAEEVSHWLETVMVEEMSKIVQGVPIRVDVSVGREWH